MIILRSYGLAVLRSSRLTVLRSSRLTVLRSSPTVLRSYALAVFILMTTMLSCDYIHFDKGAKPEEPYAARVYDQYLYLSELQNQLPEDMSVEDSLYWTRNYINLWVLEQLFLYQAVHNLSDKEQDFTPQLEAYKNSLLLYAYENRLIAQNLDTLISNTEIQQYYQEHIDDFILNRNTVKTLYVGIWADSTKIIKDFKKIIAKTPLSLSDMEIFCEDLVVPISYFDTTEWFYFDDILNIIPLQTDNPESWLKYNRSKEFSDENYWYYLLITDSRLKDAYSPLELEQERIRKTILVRRKETLLKDIKRNIFDDAQKNGAFEVF